MQQLAIQLWRATYSRYLGASMVSLGVDLTLFMALVAAGMAPALVSAISYSAGILTHWIISSRMVFADSLGATAGARGRQQALFVVSALVGLGVTIAIVAIGARLGIDPRIAKLIAVATSFQLTYLLRSRIVFA